MTTKLKEDVFNKLLDADRDAVRATDNHGSLPLHYCLEQGDPNGVASKLAGLDSAQCLVADHAGDLPLHKSCRAGDADITRLLLKLRPDTAGVRNNEADLPVTLFSQSSEELDGADNANESLETIWTLLLMHPDAVHQ